MPDSSQISLFPTSTDEPQDGPYPFRWEKGRSKGYEVSSRGDRRFSAFYATLPACTMVCFPATVRPIQKDASIEALYQIGIKGYPSMQAGKGKPPRHSITREQQILFYYELWRTWAGQNPLLMDELAQKATEAGGVLTDCFAQTPINQAAMLAHILNHRRGVFKTKVVHQKKSAFQINIGRPGIWGNPFSHIQEKNTLASFTVDSREDAIMGHRHHLLYQSELVAQLPTLKGKVLGCWCKPLSCHGDTLAEWAELF